MFISTPPVPEHPNWSLLSSPRPKRKERALHSHRAALTQHWSSPLLFPSLPQKQNRWWKSSTSARARRNNRSHRAGVAPAHARVQELLEIGVCVCVCLFIFLHSPFTTAAEGGPRVFLGSPTRGEDGRH